MIGVVFFTSPKSAGIVGPALPRLI